MAANAPEVPADTAATAAAPHAEREQWFRRRWVQNVGAFILYQVAAVVLFGLGSLSDPTHRVVGGVSSDGDAFLWFMAWWPHAIAHGIDPFFTHDVWAPNGISLIWTTSVPVPSLALSPVTAAFGPIAGFNALQLLSPALDAWATYLLCRRVSGDGLAALAGGAFVGFGSYEVVQVLAAHPNLGLVFGVPLCAYLVVRRLEGSIGPVAFVLLLGATLAVQFGVSTEILATMTIMGALAGAAGLIFATSAIRRVLVRTAPLALGAYAFAAVLVSPALYAAAHLPRPLKPHTGGLPAASWTQLRTFVVPGDAAEFHGGLLGRVPGANGAYLGIALVAVMILVAVTGHHRRLGSLLLLMAAVAAVLSFGGSLRVGDANLPLPWRVFGGLPLIKLAAPSRIVLFAVLAGAISISLLASERGRAGARAVRWGLVVLALLSVAPNLTGQHWSGLEPDPPFFAAGLYRQVVRPGETVAVVWYRKGDQMYWQAETGMSMRLAGGYLGVRPPGFLDATFALKLSAGVVRPRQVAVLRRFVVEHDVAAILVVRAPPAELEAIDAAFGVPPHTLGGVTVYRLRP